MSTRSIMHREFPRGWWRSRHWWLAGTLEFVLGGVAAVAAVLLVREAQRVLRHRRSPWQLSRQRVPAEGWLAGLVVGLAMVGCMTASLLAPGELTLGYTGTATVLVWFLLNAAVSATALYVLLTSRLRQGSAWKDLDFIERHLPRYGSPPGTSEEYRALWLNSEFEANG